MHLKDTVIQSWTEQGCKSLANFWKTWSLEWVYLHSEKCSDDTDHCQKGSVTGVFSELNEYRSSIKTVSDQYSHICIRPVRVGLIQIRIYKSVSDPLPNVLLCWVFRIWVPSADFPQWKMSASDHALYKRWTGSDNTTQFLLSRSSKRLSTKHYDTQWRIFPLKLTDRLQQNDADHFLQISDVKTLLLRSIVLQCGLSASILKLVMILIAKLPWGSDTCANQCFFQGL